MAILIVVKDLTQDFKHRLQFSLITACNDEVLAVSKTILQKCNKFSSNSLVFLGIAQFHVTTRLKAHITQRLLNSFTSLDSRKSAPTDEENPKKDAGLPPAYGVVKSKSDATQLNHVLNNGHESDSIHNRQVRFRNTNQHCCIFTFDLIGLPQLRPFLSCLPDYCSDITKFTVVMQEEKLCIIESPARELGIPEHSWIGRTTSKLRSLKSGFGVLNATQCSTDDILLQVCPLCYTFNC